MLALQLGCDHQATQCEHQVADCPDVGCSLMAGKVHNFGVIALTRGPAH